MSEDTGAAYGLGGDPRMRGIRSRASPLELPERIVRLIREFVVAPTSLDGYPAGALVEVWCYHESNLGDGGRGRPGL